MRECAIAFILDSRNEWVRIDSVTSVGKQPIYDIEILHPCHCYYGNGLVNHNTGKSLLAQYALVETQRRNGITAMVDSEFGFNPDWFTRLGGDPDRLIWEQPDHIEECYDFMEDLIIGVRNKNADVPITIVYDSVAASPSKHEFENAMGTADMAKRAQKQSQGLRNMMGLTKKANVTFIAINQLRSTLALFGPDMDTTGGQLWKYAPSVRMALKKGKRITKSITGVDKDKVLGIGGSLEVFKNRISTPFRRASFDIYFDSGVDPLSGIYDILLAEELAVPQEKADGEGIRKGYYNYNGTTFSKNTIKELVEAHPELLGGHEINLATPDADELDYSDEMDDDDIIEEADM